MDNCKLPIPVIELSIQAMGEYVRNAMMVRGDEMQQLIADAVAQVCTGDSLRAYVAERTAEIVKSEAIKQVENYFKYGPGHQNLRDSVWNMLQAAADNAQEPNNG